jgi:hypothetical protein
VIDEPEPLAADLDARMVAGDESFRVFQGQIVVRVPPQGADAAVERRSPRLNGRKPSVSSDLETQ